MKKEAEAVMRVLSSEQFIIPAGSTIPLDAIKKWWDNAGCGLNGCRLILTAEATSRQRKMSAARQLEELIVDNVVEDGNDCAIWKRFEYNFCFLAQKYLWNNEEIYITVNEALFLYRWLMLHDDIYKAQMYYLGNMRKRLGKAFLAEVVE
jgi:hypothetical protein